jgi:hypothetical protein
LPVMPCERRVQRTGLSDFRISVRFRDTQPGSSTQVKRAYLKPNKFYVERYLWVGQRFRLVREEIQIRSDKELFLLNPDLYKSFRIRIRTDQNPEKIQKNLVIFFKF